MKPRYKNQDDMEQDMGPQTVFEEQVEYIKNEADKRDEMRDYVRSLY